MHKKIYFICLIILGTLTSCISLPAGESTPTPIRQMVQSPTVTADTPTAQPTQVPEQPKVLTVCMKDEPASLFYYTDQSLAAQEIYQSLYDGPIDYVDYVYVPRILERIPSLENGDVALTPVELQEGDLLIDNQGAMVVLEQGVNYRPSGCIETDCAVTYSGEGQITIDQVVVSYQLRKDVFWSDGVPLIAADSVFSYEIARQLYGDAWGNAIMFADSYQAEGEYTVVWRGIPGFQGVRYAAYFFHPLPQHVFGDMSIENIIKSEAATVKPLGWGAYAIEEWVSGDHISLTPNPFYFGRGENAPGFDALVYRFIPQMVEAMKAFEIGECDVLDATYAFESDPEQLSALRAQGDARVVERIGSAWEHLTFGIESFEPSANLVFSQAQTRKALAMCVDRVKLAQSLGTSDATALSTVFFPPTGYPPDEQVWEDWQYDPQKANQMLEEMGWRDDDDDPDTPRVAYGVPGVVDGTLLQANYLVPEGQSADLTAPLVQDMARECGFALNLNTLPWEEMFASGPDGPVFGRTFELAQFAWGMTDEAICRFYTSLEIPGPYPEYPKGWGGGNAGGYRNAEFDSACLTALSVLPDSSQYLSAYGEAMEIFRQDLPVFPLYLHFQTMLVKDNICGLLESGFGKGILYNIEILNTCKN